jgi:hypothetical protein
MDKRHLSPFDTLTGLNFSEENEQTKKYDKKVEKLLDKEVDPSEYLTPSKKDEYLQYDNDTVARFSHVGTVVPEEKTEGKPEDYDYHEEISLSSHIFADKLTDTIIKQALEREIQRITDLINEKYPEDSEEKRSVLNEEIKKAVKKFNGEPIYPITTPRLEEKAHTFKNWSLQKYPRSSEEKTESSLGVVIPPYTEEANKDIIDSSMDIRKADFTKIGEEIHFEDVKALPPSEKVELSPEDIKIQEELYKEFLFWHQKLNQKPKKEMSEREQNELMSFNMNPYGWINNATENAKLKLTNELAEAKDKRRIENINRMLARMDTHLSNLKDAYEKNIPLKLNNDFTIRIDNSLIQVSTKFAQDYVAERLNVVFNEQGESYTVTGNVQRGNELFLTLENSKGEKKEIDIADLSKIIKSEKKPLPKKEKITIIKRSEIAPAQTQPEIKPRKEAIFNKLKTEYNQRLRDLQDEYEKLRKEEEGANRS